MKTLTAALVAVPLAAGCLTSQDLLAVSGELDLIAAQYAELEEALADKTVPPHEIDRLFADLQAQMGSSADTIEELGEEIEERTKGIIEGVGGLESSGIMTILGMVGLHFFRNTTRKKQLAEVKGGKPQFPA